MVVGSACKKAHDTRIAYNHSLAISPSCAAPLARLELPKPDHGLMTIMPDSASDLESRQQYVTGFASLANFVASDRDRTTLIFKRFDELAARNLLYLQSELAELYAKQRRLDLEDVSATLKAKQCARNFADFEKAAGDGGDAKQKEKKDLMLQIRSTLKEYRESLIFESTLATLPNPSKRVLRAFQNEFHNRLDGKGQPFPTLGGSSADVYDDVDDLVALRVEDSKDRLTRFAQAYLAFLFPVNNEAL